MEETLTTQYQPRPLAKRPPGPMREEPERARAALDGMRAMAQTDRRSAAFLRDVQEWETLR